MNKATPLYWAFKKGHLEVVRLLIDKGARLDAKDVQRHPAPRRVETATRGRPPPRRQARPGGRGDAGKYTLPTTRLTAATSRSSASSRQGRPVTRRRTSGPRSTRVWGGPAEVVRLLIDGRLAGRGDECKYTLLHEASMSGTSRSAASSSTRAPGWTRRTRQVHPAPQASDMAISTSSASSSTRAPGWTRRLTTRSPRSITRLLWPLEVAPLLVDKGARVDAETTTRHPAPLRLGGPPRRRPPPRRRRCRPPRKGPIWRHAA